MDDPLLELEATFDVTRQGGGIKVTAGTLTISSTAAAQPVVVPSGKCLTGGATVPAGAHPVLGAFSVVDCN